MAWEKINVLIICSKERMTDWIQKNLFADKGLIWKRMPDQLLGLKDLN
jgi:hypothetical protein